MSSDNYVHTAGKAFVGAIAAGIAAWVIWYLFGTPPSTSAPPNTPMPRPVVLTARVALGDYVRAQVRLANDNGSNLDYQNCVFETARAASTVEQLNDQNTLGGMAAWNAANHNLYAYNGQVTAFTTASEARDPKLQASEVEVNQTLPSGLLSTAVQPASTEPTSGSHTDETVAPLDDWASAAADADGFIVDEESSLIGSRDKSAKEYLDKRAHLSSIGFFTLEDVGALRIEVDELNALLRRQNATLYALIAARRNFTAMVSRVAQHVPISRRNRFLKPVLMADANAPYHDYITSIIPVSKCGSTNPLSASTWSAVRQRQVQRERQVQVNQQKKQVEEQKRKVEEQKKHIEEERRKAAAEQNRRAEPRPEQRTAPTKDRR